MNAVKAQLQDIEKVLEQLIAQKTTLDKTMNYLVTKWVQNQEQLITKVVTIISFQQVNKNIKERD